MLRRLQHPHQVVLGAGRAGQHLAQPVLVVLPARDLLELGNYLIAQLLDHVLSHRVGDPPVGLVGHVQHGHRAVVLLAQDLEPLHEGEAAGVGQQQQVRLGQPLAGRADVARFHHAHVALDVGADVLGVPELLGQGDVLARLAAHRRLQRVDLRQHGQQVEAAQQLGQIARNEGVHRFLARVARAGQAREVLGDHVLLPQLAAVFHCGGVLAHASTPLHSLIESAKVPACSRITWNWPLFSEYLNAVQGIPARSTARITIG